MPQPSLPSPKVEKLRVTKRGRRECCVVDAAAAVGFLPLQSRAFYVSTLPRRWLARDSFPFQRGSQGSFGFAVCFKIQKMKSPPTYKAEVPLAYYYSHLFFKVNTKK